MHFSVLKLRIIIFDNRIIIFDSILNYSFDNVVLLLLLVAGVFVLLPVLR